jgi:homoprotocatechuate degradation regulator HpaR
MHSFDDSVPTTLYRALDAVMPPYRALFKAHKITEPQWRVLRVLWSSEKVTSAELSRRTLIQAPSLVGVLDRMESKKLITRLRSTSDRRQIYIRPTAQSRALEKKVSPQLLAIHQSFMKTVSTNEWEQVKNVLEKLAGATAVGAGIQPDKVKAGDGMP